MKKRSSIRLAASVQPAQIAPKILPNGKKNSNFLFKRQWDSWVPFLFSSFLLPLFFSNCFLSFINIFFYACLFFPPSSSSSSSLQMLSQFFCFVTKSRVVVLVSFLSSSFFLSFRADAAFVELLPNILILYLEIKQFRPPPWNMSLMALKNK